jgi:hypothetical protein
MSAPFFFCFKPCRSLFRNHLSDHRVRYGTTCQLPLNREKRYLCFRYDVIPAFQAEFQFLRANFF